MAPYALIGLEQDGVPEHFRVHPTTRPKGVFAYCSVRISESTWTSFVIARSIAVQDDFVNTVLDLNSEIANGLHMVNITSGDKIYIERLLMQPEDF